MVVNFENRTLYHGDNLAFLRGMNSETIHPLATDPPFNKPKDFLCHSRQSGAGSLYFIKGHPNGNGEGLSTREREVGLIQNPLPQMTRN